MVNLIAREENQHGDHDGAKQIHQRRSDDGGTHPAHVFAKQPARGFAKLGNFKVFHAEGFHHAISGDCFLKNLAKIAEPGLAVLRGVADLAAEFIDRQNDQGQEHDRAQRHSPIEAEHDGDENYEGESFSKKISQIFGKRDASAFDIVDRYRKKAPRRMVLKKPDRLADELGVHGVA